MRCSGFLAGVYNDPADVELVLYMYLVYSCLGCSAIVACEQAAALAAATACVRQRCDG